MSKITGLQTVLSNLNKEIEKIENKTLAGLISGAIVIAYDVVNGPYPAVPVDTGNLQNSWFITANRGEVSTGKTTKFVGDKASEMMSNHANVITREKTKVSVSNTPTVAFGFTANYAWYVHENVSINHQAPKKMIVNGKTVMVARKATAGAKFLEASIKRCQGRILEEIRKEAKV
jgi:hypothetical protein